MYKITQSSPVLKELQADDTPKTPDIPPGTSDIPGVVKNSYKDYALSIWIYLIRKVNEEGELIQPELADYLGCSRRTVQRTLNYFEKWELIEIESYNGPGKGIRIRNLWLQNDRERKRKHAWKEAYAKENEYLRTTYTPGGHARCDTKEYVSNIGKTENHTQEQHPGVAFSTKFIKNKNLSPKKRRWKWLQQFSDNEKAASKDGFQAVIMEKLRTFLESRNLNPKAVKATCDSFWLSVKNGTLGQARKALSELKRKAQKLISDMRSGLIDKVADAYWIANRFIYFHVLKPENDTPKTTKRPDDVRSGKPSSRTTPENYDEDKAKAENTRQNGFSEIIDEIFDSDSFALDEEPKPKKKSSDLVQKIRDTYENYGKKGLKSWCRTHRISYAAAQEKLDVKTS